MSASLVRKALDETTLASDEKIDHLSKAAKKKFKPLKKKKKVSQEKLLKKNLKLLKALEYKIPTKSSQKTTVSSPIEVSTAPASGKGSKKKSKSKKNPKDESVFTDEDFEKFESEYFVTS